MIRILFVCTGNVFRSLSAELALKSVLPPDGGWSVSSAGTLAREGKALRADVCERLTFWQADFSSHRPRRLTREILDAADLVIAMNSDHQELIARQFGRHAPLYMEIATGTPADFPDLDDVVPDFRTDRDGSRAYVHQAIDTIFGYRAAFLRNLPAYLPPPAPPQAPPRPPAPF